MVIYSKTCVTSSVCRAEKVKASRQSFNLTFKSMLITSDFSSSVCFLYYCALGKLWLFFYPMILEHTWEDKYLPLPWGSMEERTSAAQSQQVGAVGKSSSFHPCFHLMWNSNQQENIQLWNWARQETLEPSIIHERIIVLQGYAQSRRYYGEDQVSPAQGRANFLSHRPHWLSRTRCIP